jgi:predicted TIM-barrel fold metal-dependent hydrolase
MTELSTVDRAAPDTGEHTDPDHGVLDPHTPRIVVSVDTHIGPRLREDLRPYCPSRHLEAFDEFCAAHEAALRDASKRVAPSFTDREQHLRNLATEGHFDSAARLRDMDYDGVAAEVIFHASQNGQAVPFLPPGVSPSGNSTMGVDSIDLGMAAVGQRIYNHWLADFVAQAPARRVGLAAVPYWDIEAATAEVEWAAAAGLGGVNFPAMRDGVTPYDLPDWDPFWSACAAHRMPLANHAGAGDGRQWQGLHAAAMMALEAGGWLSRRAIHFMIFSGVFERHPDLRVVATEQPGTWWTPTAVEYDSLYLKWPADSDFRRAVPKSPSEYMDRNIYLGASFMSPVEAADSVATGYWPRVLWGSDYPHSEGTFQVPHTPDEPSQTKLALRHAFHDTPSEATAAMIGGNAIEAYNLDRGELEAVARRIQAPSLDELSRPIDEVPYQHGFMTFRTRGPWS